MRRNDIGSILIGQRSVEHDNKLLNKIVQDKKKQVERVNYEKYKGVFEKAAAFLKRKRALLYGGVAVNEMLPPRFKIYEPATLPDIDVLTPEPKKLANALAKYLRKKGHEAVTVGEALHVGTHKVFADGIQVADITGCSPTTYKTLAADHLPSSLGIKTVPPLFIRMTLHKIMAEPNDAHRWPNVYERLANFYREFPPVSCNYKNMHHTNEHAAILQNMRDALKQSSAVFLGIQELSWMLDDPSLVSAKKFPSLVLMVDADPAEFAQSLAKVVSQVSVQDFPADDFVPAHSVLSIGKDPVALIFKAENCYSYNSFRGIRVATIHTMLYLFLSIIMSSQKHFTKMKPFLKAITDCLSTIQQNTKKPRRKVLDEFVSTCAGPYSGIITMRRQRFKRLNALKKNKTAKRTLLENTY